MVAWPYGFGPMVALFTSQLKSCGEGGLLASWLLRSRIRGRGEGRNTLSEPCLYCFPLNFASEMLYYFLVVLQAGKQVFNMQAFGGHLIKSQQVLYSVLYKFFILLLHLIIDDNSPLTQNILGCVFFSFLIWKVYFVGFHLNINRKQPLKQIEIFY